MEINDWLIPIIVGAFFFILTQIILYFREKKAYLQKIQIAKNEVLYNLRFFVADNNLPSKPVVNSLIKSISKKYSVKETEIFTINSLFDDLIKEIMESPFLSSKIKKEYIENISQVKSTEYKDEIISETPISRTTRQKIDYFVRHEVSSIFLGILASLIGIVFSLIVLYLQDNSGHGFLFIIAAIIIIVVFGYFLADKY